MTGEDPLLRDSARPGVSGTALRRVLGGFPTGITIVTSVDAEARPVGLTVSAFASVSLDPPLVLACLDLSSRTLAAIRRTGWFAINILAAGQQRLATAFASPVADRFDVVSWTTAVTGAPVLDGTSGWLDCCIHATVEAGDHLVLIGRVVDAGSRGLAPLAHLRGAYIDDIAAPPSRAAAK